MRATRTWLLAIALSTTIFAGCLGSNQPVAPGATLQAPAAGGAIPIVGGMTFAKTVVTPAVAVTNDLYEPTIEASDTNTLYVAAHVIGAATTGTPAYFSRDDGKTWAQLPFVASVSSPVQGAQPPPGDEGFLVAGDHGQAWMADIYAAGFSVTGWCGNGASQCYDNRYAYDRASAETAPCDGGHVTSAQPSGAQTSLNDRPWSAYGGGKLLLVNNPGGGAMQIGVLDVPPAMPIGVGGGAASLNGPTWNMCASPGGSIPGVPAMRPDGFFAVPQMSSLDDSSPGNWLTVTVGNAKDITKVHNTKVFPVTSVGSGTVNGGRTAFDRDGVLYIGARNNTKGEAHTTSDPVNGDSTTYDVKQGGFVIALSRDNGTTFQNATFNVSTEVRTFYLDGNIVGPGALLVWSQAATDKTKSDWYVAHVFVGPDGRPEIRDATLAVKDGPNYSAHVMGAAAGPDGRAHFVVFEGNDQPGDTPLAVWSQKDGATLPVTVPVNATK